MQYSSCTFIDLCTSIVMQCVPFLSILFRKDNTPVLDLHNTQHTEIICYKIKYTLIKVAVLFISFCVQSSGLLHLYTADRHTWPCWLPGCPLARMMAPPPCNRIISSICMCQIINFFVSLLCLKTKDVVLNWVCFNPQESKLHYSTYT